MRKILDDILSYREMCEAENQEVMQRGMNFRMNPLYSVVLMSQKSNAPYSDKIHSDRITIEYEGHDLAINYSENSKEQDQPEKLPSGKLTQNGYFIEAVNKYKKDNKPELVKVYEKILPGTWSLKGYFDLIDYKVVNDGKRNVFRYILKLSNREENSGVENIKLEHTRLIPSEVKREVWKRDQGKCVLCGDSKNLHFDHDLPFSKGGTSLSSSNVKLLCMKHNLQKSDKIE
ncbi:MAG: HNH endonuclease [Candidatus Paceibacterota bacterium]